MIIPFYFYSLAITDFIKKNVIPSGSKCEPIFKTNEAGEAMLKRINLLLRDNEYRFLSNEIGINPVTASEFLINKLGDQGCYIVGLDYVLKASDVRELVSLVLKRWEERDKR